VKIANRFTAGWSRFCANSTTRNKAAKPVACCESYVEKMTGLSWAQATRLIARYLVNGEIQPAPYRRHRLPQRYTRADIELLALVDEAHETLSGPATRRILDV